MAVRKSNMSPALAFGILSFETDHPTSFFMASTALPYKVILTTIGRDLQNFQLLARILRIGSSILHLLYCLLQRLHASLILLFLLF